MNFFFTELFYIQLVYHFFEETIEMKIKKKKRKKKADAMPAAKLKISILIKCTSSKARFFFFEPRLCIFSRTFHTRSSRQEKGKWRGEEEQREPKFIGRLFVPAEKHS